MAAAAPVHLPEEFLDDDDDDELAPDAQFLHLTQAEQLNAWQPLPRESQIGQGQWPARDPAVEALFPLLRAIQCHNHPHHQSGSLETVIGKWTRAHAESGPLSVTPQPLCLRDVPRGGDVTSAQQHLFEVMKKCAVYVFPEESH